MVLRAAPGASVPGAAPGAKAPEESQPVAKNFGDTVVNPELMQSQNTGRNLRDAARQAAVATGAPAVAAGPDRTRRRGARSGSAEPATPSARARPSQHPGRC